MVKGMDNLDISDFAMGNGQTTAKLTDSDSGHAALKQDGKRKHDSPLELLDSDPKEQSLPTMNSSSCSVKCEESFPENEFSKRDDTSTYDCESNPVGSIQNEKIEKHFGLTFCSDSLKDLLLLHLDLMEQQQNKLLEKDKIIAQLKAEKDQLESRLTRMERRMAVQRKHTGEDISEDLGSLTYKSKQLATRLSRGPATVSAPQPVAKRARFSLSAVTVTSRQSKDRGLGTYIQTETTYLHEENTPTVIEESNKKEQKTNDFIIVPNFRVTENKNHPRSSSKRQEKVSDECLENLDDDSFYRRHQKLEMDEKRRKRWDIQHTRNQRQQENLKCRQKGREVPRITKGQKRTEETEKQSISSLMPDPEKLIAIEVSTQVPVSAFGSRIPAIQQREFNLPWFDIAKREVQLRQMKERREKREKDRQRKRSRRKNTRRW